MYHYIEACLYPFSQELTESLGKAKSEVAEEEKEWEKKLLQLQQASEQRAKTVRTDALHECHRAHQGAWQQVFPDVEVFCGDHYEKWLEEFEAKAKAFVDSKKSEVCHVVVDLSLLAHFGRSMASLSVLKVICM